MIESFLTFDSGASLSEAVQQVNSLEPRFLVVHDRDEEDDPSYFVFDVEAVQRAGSAKDSTVGEALKITLSQPVAVVDFNMVGLDFRRAAGSSPVLLIEDGVVRGLAEAREPTTQRFRRRRGFQADVDRGGGGVPTSGGPVVSGGGGPVVSGGGGPVVSGGGGDGGGAPEPGLTAMAVAVDYPKAVVLDDTISVLVSLTLDPLRPDVIPIAVAVDDVIDVVVSARSGFDVVGRAEVQLRVTDDAEPLPAQVKLRATTLGVGRITVYAFLRGSALGSLTINPEVVAVGVETGPRAAATAALDTHVAGNADLSLLIFVHQDSAGRSELLFKLDAPDRSLGLNLKSFGPIRLETPPATYFADQYAEINELPVETKRLRKIAAERLAAIGSSLFQQLLPEDLQALLWGLRERIHTVFIQSEEPWVPWEICRLQGKEGDRVVEGPFFCEQFEVTRWTMGTPLIPELTFRDLAVIAPPSNLSFAKAEVAMLLTLAGTSRSVKEVTPATYSNVRNALGAGQHDGIHFVGHGRYPENGNAARAEIGLQGAQPLTPTDITGVVNNLGIPKPLVFLNACEVGRQGRGLTGLGGWATELLRAGAGAFVGSYWNVTDDLAVDFSTAFYQRLLAGDTVGAATRTARLAIRDADDPTWLAYTAFADPGARITS
jgi:hypothetical protein